MLNIPRLNFIQVKSPKVAASYYAAVASAVSQSMNTPEMLPI